MQPEAPEGSDCWYIHTSKSTMTRMVASGELQSRYLFKSRVQCAFHQIAHDHFGLSQSQIRADSVIMQLHLPDAFIEEHGSQAVNGFLKSVSIQSLPVEHLKITGAIFMNLGMKEFMDSTEGVNLTRRSVSHFEAFYGIHRMAELRVLSPECLLALGCSTPHSSKVHSTLRHQ
eukprot:2752773-Amphidinium_carterae.1